MTLNKIVLLLTLCPFGAAAQHYHATDVSLHPNASILEFTTERFTNDDADEAIPGTERNYKIDFAERTMEDKKTKEVRKFTEAEAVKMTALVDYVPELTQRLSREWCSYDSLPARVIEWKPWQDNGRIDFWAGDEGKPYLTVINGRAESKTGPTAECTKSGTITAFTADTSVDTHNLLVISSIWTQYAAESAEWWDAGFGKQEELRAARLW